MANNQSYSRIYPFHGPTVLIDAGLVAKTALETPQILLTWSSVPIDVAGFRIVRRRRHYPKDVADGFTVYQIDRRPTVNYYADTLVEPGVTYYYKVFYFLDSDWIEAHENGKDWAFSGTDPYFEETNTATTIATGANLDSNDSQVAVTSVLGFAAGDWAKIGTTAPTIVHIREVDAALSRLKFDAVAAITGDNNIGTVRDTSLSFTRTNTQSKSVITRATGSFVADGYLAGMNIRVAKSPLNSGSFTVESVSETQLLFPNTNWAQTGNGLTISGTATPALARLTNSRVAFIDTFNDSLRTYNFDGENWTQVGPGNAVSVGPVSIAALSSTRIALVDTLNDELRTYDFDGTNWAQVGPGNSIPAVGSGAITALSSTRIATIDTNTDELRTYAFDGTNWAQVGAGLSVPITGAPALATISSSRVAFIDGTGGTLRLYDFNGAAWTVVGGAGSELLISGVGAPALANLDSSRVALVDGGNLSLRVYTLPTGTLYDEAASKAPIIIPPRGNIQGERVVKLDFKKSFMAWKLYDLLPSATQADDEEVGQGLVLTEATLDDGQKANLGTPGLEWGYERYLRTLATELGRVRAAAAYMPTLVDLLETPTEFLRELAGLYVYSPPSDADAYRLRNLIAMQPFFVRRRGREDALTVWTQLVTGQVPELVFGRDRVALLNSHGLEDGLQLTTTAEDLATGDTSLLLTSATGITAGDWIRVGSTYLHVTSVAVNTVNFDNVGTIGTIYTGAPVYAVSATKATGGTIAWDGKSVSTGVSKSASHVAFIDDVNESLRVYFFDGATWVQVGTSFSIPTIGVTALATLSSTRIAFIDDTNDSLRAYDFNGTTWAQVGNGFAIAGVSEPSLAAMSSTRVAFIDAANDELRTYDFDGTNWALVGNALAIGSTTSTLTALSTTRVAFIDSTNDSLRAYDFDGTNWTLTGSGLAIGTVGTPALAALSSNRVAFIDSTNLALRTYDFNGTNWAQVGNSLVIATTGWPALAALSATRVAFMDDINESLRAYDFNGTDWALVGSGLTITGTNVPELTPIYSVVSTITDTAANYVVNSLVGHTLQPDITDPATFLISANMSTTITTAAGDMTAVAASGDTYQVIISHLTKTHFAKSLYEYGMTTGMNEKGLWLYVPATIGLAELDALRQVLADLRPATTSLLVYGANASQLELLT